MRQIWKVAGVCAVALLGAGAIAQAQVKAGKGVLLEDWVKDPMPPGFQVVNVDLEGTVFADANGKTLYYWPVTGLRNGDAGDQKNKSSCDDTKITVNAGLMSPYPGGLELPEVATRPTCAQVWPAVLAAPDAKPVGKWSIITRGDGKKQWAYDNNALYTSVLDQRIGDVRGGTRKEQTSEDGAVRQPAGPTPNLPAQFKARSMATGRLVATADTGRSLYTWDKDTATKSMCDAACQREWQPVLAPESVQPQGEWTIIQNSPGTKQWVFRGKPVYTHLSDDKTYSVQGGDIPGWHNVYTQLAPPPPKGWYVSDNRTGQVLSNEAGRTVYYYNCNDDAVDQLACNHPDAPQAYRLAICGRGLPELCLKNFPYVIAPKDAQPVGNTWSAVYIDPKTGKYAKAGDAGALYVWAYRGRPVYHCGKDKKPGDIECDTYGEFNGARNGYKAFWMRDDFGRQSG